MLHFYNKTLKYCVKFQAYNQKLIQKHTDFEQMEAEMLYCLNSFLVCLFLDLQISYPCSTLFSWTGLWLLAVCITSLLCFLLQTRVCEDWKQSRECSFGNSMVFYFYFFIDESRIVWLYLKASECLCFL